MISSLSLLTTMPATPQGSSAKALVLKGANLNTAAYVATAPPTGSAGSQLTVSVAVKSPGQAGSSRAQILHQITLIDATGKPRVVSANLTLSIPKDFVPQDGANVDILGLTKQATAGLIGYLTNPANAATASTPNAVLESLVLGALP